MSSLVKRSASWMAQAVHSRGVSAVELIDAHAARIDARNPDVHAIVVLRLEEAREEARWADALLARGELLGPSPHAGDPITGEREDSQRETSSA